MDLVALILSIVSLLGFTCLALFPGFLRPYLAEKGKNLASKEDLAHLTSVVEAIKAQHGTEIERVKAGLQAEGLVAERRRRVYEEMCAALRVFQHGHGGNEDKKERFHAAHAAAWLWASDAVLLKLNRCIEMQVRNTAQPGSVSQLEMKQAYADVILAMRKDAGFPTTAAAANEYQFVEF